MKKIILLICIYNLHFFLISEPVYKKFTFDNKEINKWVELKEVEEKKSYEKNRVDENGKIIAREENDGSITYFDYSEENKIVHGKNSSGDEFWIDYVIENNLKKRIYKNNKNYQSCTEFQTDGETPVHFKDNDIEEWYFYDENNFLCLIKNANGEQEYIYNKYHSNGEIASISTENENYEYDEDGNEIYSNIYGMETWNTFENNTKTYSKVKYDSGFYIEEWYDGNNIIKEKTEDTEEWIEYNEYNKKTYSKKISPISTTEKWYDSNENIIHSKIADYEEWFEYEYDENNEISVKKEQDTYKFFLNQYYDNGLLIYSTSNYMPDMYYDYDFYPNGQIKNIYKYTPF